MAVVDAFYAVPHGGVEIAGVLFGTREDGSLRIADYRKIETEYLTGPSFRPSENDLAGLQTLLAETRFKDPEIQPLGWFVSRTRSGIRLSEQDLEFYRRFFPEPWQVALVLRPDKLGMVRGGYFFRQAGGIVGANASIAEFTLEPYFGEKQAPLEESAQTGAPLDLQAEGSSAVTLEPPSSGPVTPEPLLFQSITRNSSWSIRKRVFVVVLTVGAAAAAFARYWVSTH